MKRKPKTIMRHFFRTLANIGISEFVLIFLLLVAVSGIFALTSNVSFQQVINPPPPPQITTVLGDERSRAVLVIGKSELADAGIRVYGFSDPILVETAADREGVFYAVFTEDVLPSGIHEFTATTILNEQQTTDPAPRLAILVNDDFTVAPVPGRTAPEVKIGNADAATSELLRAIIRNQRPSAPVAPQDMPQENRQANRARTIQGGLLVLVVLETALLLVQRAQRKQLAQQSFFHLGPGFYRLPERR